MSNLSNPDARPSLPFFLILTLPVPVNSILTLTPKNNPRPIPDQNWQQMLDFEESNYTRDYILGAGDRGISFGLEVCEA